MGSAKNRRIPSAHPTDWRAPGNWLSVGGVGVNVPAELTFDDLQKMPAFINQCSGNRRGLFVWGEAWRP